MGSFVFKWEHPASDVYVTGTFDDWSKSEKLAKTGDHFEKDVSLPSASEKIYYKFVVDGNWVTDHTAPQENDASGNLNNVLTTDRIVKPTSTESGVMAAASSDVPGTFPETPAAVETEKDAFSVSPLPATEGAVNPITLAPGEQVPHPTTLTPHTLTSGVHDDPELVAADQAKSESEPTFSVAPLPAFAGAVNPVQVAPGEALPRPSVVTDQSINSAVRLDKESYENSGALGHAPVLPPVVTPQRERDEKGTGIFDLPPITNSIIPESSLPVEPSEAAAAEDAVPTIQSVGAESTTTQLAGEVPLESSKVPEVPEVVKESQEKAGSSPEASAVPEEVKEKSEVEKALLSKVPEAPPTSQVTDDKEATTEATDQSDKGITGGEVAAVVGGAAAVVGGAAAALASEAANKLPDSVTSKLPESVQKSISEVNAKSDKDTAADTAPAETAPVEAVPVEAAPVKVAPVETAPFETATKEAEAAQTTALDTPEVVKESIAESGFTPEAAGNEEAVVEKQAVEKELLSEVKPQTATGEPAPTTASTLAPVPTVRPAESREVSPGTIPGDHTTGAPVVTTGVTAATTEQTSGAPSTSTTTGNSSTAEAITDKKKKRSSIFGRLKAKFSDKK